MTDPDVVGWFLGGQQSTRAGQFFAPDFIVFFYSAHRETPKNMVKKKRKKIGIGFFVDFFVKRFFF
jgi:hypothetical protein